MNYPKMIDQDASGATYGQMVPISTDMMWFFTTEALANSLMAKVMSLLPDPARPNLSFGPEGIRLVDDTRKQTIPFVGGDPTVRYWQIYFTVVDNKDPNNPKVIPVIENAGFLLAREKDRTIFSTVDEGMSIMNPDRTTSYVAKGDRLRLQVLDVGIAQLSWGE